MGKIKRQVMKNFIFCILMGMFLIISLVLIHDINNKKQLSVSTNIALQQSVFVHENNDNNLAGANYGNIISSEDLLSIVDLGNDLLKISKEEKSSFSEMNKIDTGAFNSLSLVNDEKIKLSEDVTNSNKQVSKDKLIIKEEDNHYVFNGLTQYFVKSSSNPNGALWGVDENTMIVQGDGKINAGVYKVGIILKDGYEWDDGTTDKLEFTFEIKKADYILDGVELPNKTFRYDGKAKGLDISNLNLLTQQGINVKWDNGRYRTEPGIYNITATLVGNQNYNELPKLEGVLTINPVSIKLENENFITSVQIDCLNTSQGFIEAGSVLSISELQKQESLLFTTQGLFERYVGNNEEIITSYDINLLKDGQEAKTQGLLQVRFLMPENIKDRNFKILHVHEEDMYNVVEEVNYTFDGDYIVFEVNNLSEFTFIGEIDSGFPLWATITISSIAGLLLLTIILYYISYAIWKKKGRAIMQDIVPMFRKTNKRLVKTEYNDVEIINMQKQVLLEKETQERIKQQLEVDGQEMQLVKDSSLENGKEKNKLPKSSTQKTRKKRVKSRTRTKKSSKNKATQEAKSTKDKKSTSKKSSTTKKQKTSRNAKRDKE